MQHEQVSANTDFWQCLSWCFGVLRETTFWQTAHAPGLKQPISYGLMPTMHSQPFAFLILPFQFNLAAPAPQRRSANSASKSQNRVLAF